MKKMRSRVLARAWTYTAILFSIAFFTATAVMAGGPVDVTVDVSPALKAQTKPEQVVFIFAKAVRGPKAPLAVVRATVSQLPLSVRLDDSKAVMPMFRISNFDEVRIEARISTKGDARKASGDLEGASKAIKTDGPVKPVHLIIDRIVK